MLLQYTIQNITIGECFEDLSVTDYTLIIVTMDSSHSLQMKYTGIIARSPFCNLDSRQEYGVHQGYCRVKYKRRYLAYTGKYQYKHSLCKPITAG